MNIKQLLESITMPPLDPALSKIEHAEAMARYRQDPATLKELRRIIEARHRAVSEGFAVLAASVEAFKQGMLRNEAVGLEGTDLAVLGESLEKVVTLLGGAGKRAVNEVIRIMVEEKATGQHEYELLTEEGKKYFENLMEKRLEAAAGEARLRNMLKGLISKITGEGEDPEGKFPVAGGFADASFTPPAEGPTDLGPIGGTGPETPKA